MLASSMTMIGSFPPKLEHLPLVDRFRRDVLADGNAAGERDEVHVGVRQHLVGDLARIAGDDREHRRRQAGFVEDVGEQERA